MCIRNGRTTFARFLIGIFAATLLLVSVGSGIVLAHTPHDDVQDLEISPGYETDRTVFAIVRGNFFRTVDGGETWQRELRGLNNTVGLSSLALSTADGVVLYAGTHNAQIFKTENGGDSWVDVTSNLEATTLHVLEVAPDNPDVVLLLDADGRLYRSEDGADSWTAIDASPLAGRQLTMVAFPASDSRQAFAGDTEGLIYRSGDLGQSWQQLGATEGAAAITAIAFSDDFSADGILFAGTSEGGLFKSSDGGETFVPQEDGLPRQEVTDILAPPGFAESGELYALSRDGGVYQSLDGGNRWKRSSEGTWRNNQSLEYGRPSFSVIRATPSYAEDDTLFLGSFVGIFQSTDRSKTWQKQITLPENIVAGVALSESSDAAPSLAATHYIGELLIDNGSETIQVKFSKGLSQLAFLERLAAPIVKIFRPQLDSSQMLEMPFRLLDVAFSPNYEVDQTMFVSMINHLLISEDGGRNWEITRLYPDRFGLSTISEKEDRNIPYLIIPSPDFARDQTLLIGMSGGDILRSQDRGKTLTRIGRVPGGGLSALAISPNFTQDQTLFGANTLSGIAKSTDGGQTWAIVYGAGEGDPKGLYRQVHLAISPNFAADQFILAGTDAGLLQSVDGGESWQQAQCEFCGQDSAIAAVTISPNFADDQTIFVSVKGRGLFKSTDGGQTYMEIAESLLDEGIVISNLDETPPTSGNLKLSPTFERDQTMVGYSDIAMVRSTDSGNSWDNLADMRASVDETHQVNIIYGRYLVLSLMVLLAIVAVVLFVLLVVVVVRRRRALSPKEPVEQLSES